jgi:hypothetical protein
MTAIPPYRALFAFLETLSDALDRAHAGAFADGYDLLLLEWLCARQRVASDNGWHRLLAEKSREACDDYIERFGVRMEDPPRP